MKIAVLAPFLVPSHPAGGQMLKVIQGLKENYEFTVFGADIHHSVRDRIRFRKLFIPKVRPRLATYVLQFLAYGNLFKRQKLYQRFDVVHSLEGGAPFATLVTMHFCGAAALDLMHKGTMSRRGVRRPYYELLYRIGLRMERSVVKNPYLRRLVCVSEGLKREISHYYQPRLDPIVIQNSVDVERLSRAADHRDRTRAELGLADRDVVGVICALGDWERKGLGIVIEAIELLRSSSVKVIVIGGSVEPYITLCKDKGISDNFVFVGFAQDTERFYGAADFFVFPTSYEAWPVTALEAAAAGLPLLATNVNGLEDFIKNEINGLFIDRTPESTANAIGLVVKDVAHLRKMGQEAQRRVQAFGTGRMVDAYNKLYLELA